VVVWLCLACAVEVTALAADGAKGDGGPAMRSHTSDVGADRGAVAGPLGRDRGSVGSPSAARHDDHDQERPAQGQLADRHHATTCAAGRVEGIAAGVVQAEGGGPQPGQPGGCPC
jgi:hypothetical protein